MPSVALFFGGIIGAAQLTVMWGLLPNSYDEAGWLLLVVPIGALLGTLAAASITRFKLSAERGWPVFLGAWGLSVFLGFPVAMLAPLMLTGAGPDPQNYRFIAFFFEYGFAWLAMFLLFKPDNTVE